MMQILSTVLGLGAILFSISAWQIGYGASFWNLTHSVAFTLLPMLGTWMLWKTVKDASEDL